MQSSSPLYLSTSTRPTTLFQRIAHPIGSLLPRLRRSQKLRGRDDMDGLIAPARQQTPRGSPVPTPRSSPPPLTPSSPAWMITPPSPSSTHTQEAQTLGASIGYGRPAPFLNAPPLRRATTDAVSGRYTSSSSAIKSRRLVLGYANGDLNPLEKPALDEGADEAATWTSSGTGTGRRRLHTTDEGVF